MRTQSWNFKILGAQTYPNPSTVLKPGSMEHAFELDVFNDLLEVTPWFETCTSQADLHQVDARVYTVVGRCGSLCGWQNESSQNAFDCDDNGQLDEVKPGECR